MQQANVKVAVQELARAIKTGDLDAWGKLAPNIMFHPTACAAGGTPQRELSPMMGVFAIALGLARILGDIKLDPALASPQASSSKGGRPPAAIPALTPPSSRVALQRVVDSITSAGNMTLGNGVFTSVVPVSNRGWGQLTLATIPASKDATGEVGGAVSDLYARLGGNVLDGRRTQAHLAAEVQFCEAVELEAQPLGICVALIAALYCREAVTVGGENIGDAATLLSRVRIDQMARSNGTVGPPPVLVFVKRMIMKLAEYRTKATKRFWEWVKENTMAVFDFVCLPHDAAAASRRLDLPAMYTSPHVPPYAGPPNPVFRPSPVAAIWRRTPDPNHGMIYRMVYT